MKKHKSIVLSLLFLAIAVISNASESKKYNISVTIKGNENSFITIGFHLGDKQYIKDTIQSDSNGTAIYSGEGELEQGLYMVLLPDKRYFDIIVDSDQDFSISCSKDDILGSTQFEGSEENQNFIDYQRVWRKYQELSREYMTEMQAHKDNIDSLTAIRMLAMDHDIKMIDFLKETANINPDSFLSLLVKALIPIQPPEFDIPETEHNPDSLRWIKRYNYNKDHFFDYIDLSDSRLIRTPVLYGKLNAFFSGMIIQHPDSVMNIIPPIVEQTKNDSAMFRYVVSYLFNHFRTSRTVGHDGVMVKIIDDYYLSGRAYWAPEKSLLSLRDEANRLRPNLMGVKAVNFVMETYDGSFQSLYDINSEYTIVYFWEPNCGHCKTTTPLLKEFYKKNKDSGIEIFAVCTQYKRDEWENYITEHELNWINGWDPERATHYDFFYNVTATPLLYVLDKDKIIVAKKIGVESLEDVLRMDRLKKKN